MGDEGRGDDEDIFGDECIAKLAKILGVQDDPKLGDFADDLRAFGIQRRKVIRSMPIALPIAPCDASLSRRIEWLETQVINPAQKLLGALQPEQRPYFSDWSEEYAIKNPIDLDSMSAEIGSFLGYSIRLHASLKSQLEQNISHLSELRYDIVYELVELLQSHFPKIRLSRGEYYTELGKTIGAVPDFVRAAYEEITGSSEKLDAPIRSTIQLFRKSRRKLR